MPVVKWVVPGGVSGPVYAFGITAWQGTPLDSGWNDPAVWLVWVLGIVLSLIGAFVRPGGLHAARWLHVWVDYHLAPKRAVWRPTGKE